MNDEEGLYYLKKVLDEPDFIRHSGPWLSYAQLPDALYDSFPDSKTYGAFRNWVYRKLVHEGE
jgi:hypothetical protein